MEKILGRNMLIMGIMCAAMHIRGMQPAHPWTNGQVQRMNKTIKEAIPKTMLLCLS